MSMRPEVEPITGHSPDGFSAAARDAVERYEEAYGKPEHGETIKLPVVKLEVEFENPVRDYFVTLGPSG